MQCKNAAIDPYTGKPEMPGLGASYLKFRLLKIKIAIVSMIPE
jgi:hypothetical protein